jgi:hypothetical protein
MIIASRNRVEGGVDGQSKQLENDSRIMDKCTQWTRKTVH